MKKCGGYKQALRTIHVKKLVKLSLSTRNLKKQQDRGKKKSWSKTKKIDKKRRRRKKKKAIIKKFKETTKKEGTKAIRKRKSKEGRRRQEKKYNKKPNKRQATAIKRATTAKARHFHSASTKLLLEACKTKRKVQKKWMQNIIKK